jgi:GAF domain-containing protein
LPRRIGGPILKSGRKTGLGRLGRLAVGGGVFVESGLTTSRICRALDRFEGRGASIDALLTYAVEQLHTSDPRFEWTAIYGLHHDGILRLGPFVGAPSGNVFVAVGDGIRGAAVAEGRNINVPVDSEAPEHAACPAGASSELVVLIRRGEKIYAQIDIASAQPNAFGAGLVAEIERLADRLALTYERRDRAAA